MIGAKKGVNGVWRRADGRAVPVSCPETAVKDEVNSAGCGVNEARGGSKCLIINTQAITDEAGVWGCCASRRPVRGC